MLNARALGVADRAAEDALEQLCSIYWYPLYAFVRRSGRSPHDAEDLTQAFFAKVLAGDVFGSASSEKGKLRSFLLGAMKHFLASEWRKESAEKRGGGATQFSIDATQAEEWLEREGAPSESPERQFERSWAHSTLEAVMARLEEDYNSRGKGALFSAIRGHLAWNEGRKSYDEIAEELNMAEGSVRVAVHTMRKRYGANLREEILATVGDPAEVDAEVAYLKKVLSGG